MSRKLVFLAALLVAAPALAAAPAAKTAARSKPTPPPAPSAVLAYVVPDGDGGAVTGCDEGCFKAAAAKVRNRRGVKKVTVEANALVLEVQAGFHAADVIKGVDGMKIEMRAPYKSIELHFVAGGPFPPVSRLEENVLVVETSDQVKKVVEAATGFKMANTLKCFGKLTGNEATEAILTRYEEEKRPPLSMIPFLVEADLDGDKKPDLYLRLDGMPEVVVFNNGGDLKAVPVAKMEVENIPRCDASPTRFVRAVPKQKVKCMAATPHAGDAVERVTNNSSNDLLLFSNGKFTTCEPLGEGAIPDASKKDGVPVTAKPTEKKDDNTW